jgi:DNA polymerase-3 subunit delta'
MLAEVKGQDEAVAYLQRVADGRYTAPLLLLGDDGVGRRFSVQCLARQMFCDGVRDNTCDCVHCTQLKYAAHADFVTFTAPEDKDIGIEVSRQIIEQCRSYPMLASKRVVLIDGAERLTVPAANALLKTLEEPPRTVRFFLTSTSLERVIPTIRSRCGVVRYRRLPEAFIVSMLQPFESNWCRHELRWSVLFCPTASGAQVVCVSGIVCAACSRRLCLGIFQPFSRQLTSLKKISR